jgi:hypothetical protein
MSQAPTDGTRLKPGGSFATVPRMPAPRGPRSRRASRRRDVRRARLNALLALLAIAVVATLSLTAFSGGSAPVQTSAVAASAARLLPSGPPSPLVVATQGSLRLQLPVARSDVTVIGYHGAGESALPLEPVGRQANEGFVTRLVHRLFGGPRGGLTYYALDGGAGPSTGELDVGAAPGTDAYSPVDGTIVGLTPNVIDGHTYGERIEIQPTDAPSVVVGLDNLRPDPSLAVGSTVAASTSRVGTILDLSRVERQALSQYTQDAGDHVAITVRPAAALATP